MLHDIQLLNEQLLAQYRDAWESWPTEQCGRFGLSYPFLLRVEEGYIEAPIRWMLVGQQTGKWDWETDPRPRTVDVMLDWHRWFEQGKPMSGSPFWRAAHQLNTAFNGDRLHPGMLWNNLVRVDSHGRRPEPEVEEQFAEPNLLRDQIRITQPQAVIFCTGPDYDRRIKKTFSGAVFSELHKEIPIRELALISHNDLPVLSFRVYHPNYLSRSGRWGYIDFIQDVVFANV